MRFFENNPTAVVFLVFAFLGLANIVLFTQRFDVTALGEMFFVSAFFAGCFYATRAIVRKPYLAIFGSIVSIPILAVLANAVYLSFTHEELLLRGAPAVEQGMITQHGLRFLLFRFVLETLAYTLVAVPVLIFLERRRARRRNPGP